jgi:hypothetical protein
MRPRDCTLKTMDWRRASVASLKLQASFSLSLLNRVLSCGCVSGSTPGCRLSCLRLLRLSSRVLRRCLKIGHNHFHPKPLPFLFISSADLTLFYVYWRERRSVCRQAGNLTEEKFPRVQRGLRCDDFFPLIL